MSYQLAVDLGTTQLTAAVARPDGTVEPAALGAGADGVPAVAHLGADGTLLVGLSAQRRTLAEPDRVVQELVRRIGDHTPLVVGGAPMAAETLAARVVAHIVRTVATTEGGPAAAIAVTHPAPWGPHKLGAFRSALDAAGLDRVVLVPEPIAAAERYAATTTVEPGAVLAVLDIGGGTSDATVLRREARGFTLLGRPERIERLGGTDIDGVVFDHVRAELGDRWAGLDPSDPATLAAVATLRQDCTAAKEALSGSAETAVAVALPGLREDVRLDRARFTELIRPAVAEAVELLCRVMEPVTLPGTPTVLLVGGSARIPLVAELVAERTGLPVVLADDPVTAVAMGAALVAGPAPGRGPEAQPAGPGARGDVPTVTDVRPVGPTGPGTIPARAPAPPATLPAVPAAATGPTDPVNAIRPFRPTPPPRRRIPVALVAVAAMVAVTVLVGGLLALYRSGPLAATGTPAVAATPVQPTADPPVPVATIEPEAEAVDQPAPQKPRNKAPDPATARTATPPKAAATTAPPATTAPANKPGATVQPTAGAGGGNQQGGDQGGNGQGGTPPAGGQAGGAGAPTSAPPGR